MAVSSDRGHTCSGGVSHRSVAWLDASMMAAPSSVADPSIGPTATVNANFVARRQGRNPILPTPRDTSGAARRLAPAGNQAFAWRVRVLRPRAVVGEADCDLGFGVPDGAFFAGLLDECGEQEAVWIGADMADVGDNVRLADHDRLLRDYPAEVTGVRSTPTGLLPVRILRHAPSLPAAQTIDASVPQRWPWLT